MELVQYHDPRKDLNRLKEIRPEIPLVSLPFSPGKSAIAMFVSEYLGKVLRDGQANQTLFELSHDWICTLDQADQGLDGYPLMFLWQSLGPLGLTPDSWMDIVPSRSHLDAQQEEACRQIFACLESDINPGGGHSHLLKQWILDCLIRYVQGHLEGMGSIQSLNVLRQVFS
jgi:DNA repair protein RecO (recombination protein O)